MSPFKAAIIYFGIVFGAGFILGTIRTLLLVPRVGERDAQLIEIPFMLVVVFFASRWIVGKLRAPDFKRRLWVGGLALPLLVLAELAGAVFLRQLSLGEYIASLGSISGIAFLVALVLFALAPTIVPRRQDPGDGSVR